MAKSLNKTFTVGNLTRDPELKYTAGGKAVAKFTLATNEYGGKGKDEHVEFINFVAWDKTAEAVAEYAHKGDRLHVEGRIRTNTWEDKDGNSRKTTELHVSDLMFLTSRRDRE